MNCHNIDCTRTSYTLNIQLKNKKTMKEQEMKKSNTR